MPKEPKLIDAQFWTDWLADYVTGAIDRREAAASRLVTGIGFFWGVYTATALVGISLAKHATLDGWQVWIILAPIGSLSLSYLFALWSLNPIVGVIRQSDKAAEALWSQILSRKLFRLRIASSLLIASVGLIMAAAYIVSQSNALSR
jgi:hypothetical protein